jgi:hypothetical protein
MAHVNFNHLNAAAFNSFVPEATNVANNQFLKTALVIGGIALGIWIIYEVSQTKKDEKKEVRD